MRADRTVACCKFFCFLAVFLTFGLNTGLATEKIAGLSIDGPSGKARIVMDMTAPVPYALFTLADPYRIVIDLPEIDWSSARQSAGTAKGLVSGYRFGLFQPGNARFVLDLRQPARVSRVFFAPSPTTPPGRKAGAVRMILELDITSREEFLKTAGFKGRTNHAPAGAPPDTKTAPAPPPQQAVKPPVPISPPVLAPSPQTSTALLSPPPNPRRTVLSGVALPAAPRVAPLTPPATPPLPTAPEPQALQRPPTAPATQQRPPVAPAAQQRLIVIDAGHGGVDPGAITAQGVYEKTIVLDTAKRLQALLSYNGQYKVVMTRDTDIFVRLADRVQIARSSEADLFVSIHADALATNKVRGASVYTLSEQASDKEAELLAAKENNSDMIAGIGIGDETDELVKTILIDLAQRETTNKSVHFAKLLLPQLNNAGALLKNSHRYAGFRVLKAPDIPSVLVELGLLSNQTDARILTSTAGRQRLAEALKQAIAAYFRNVKA